jgi:predicted nucleic acid-binding Zn ribbon protein
VAERACSACGNTFALSFEFFASHPGTRDGFSSQCRGCQRAVVNRRAAERRAGVAERLVVCGVCGGSFAIPTGRPGRPPVVCSEECASERLLAQRSAASARARLRRQARGPLPRKPRPRYDRTCVVCGGDFVARRRDASVCSQKCRARRKTLRQYGLSMSGFEDLVAAQGGLCACCGKPLVDSDRASAVDHDHVTGRVRGVLHWQCNGALGILGDDAGGLWDAQVYLARADFDLRELCVT